MMKKIRNTVNVVLSAIIVALGFGSCGVSQKTYNEAQQEIERLKAENASLNQEVRNLQQQQESLVKEYQKRMEERKVVYGPRPTAYNEDINKNNKKK